MTGQTIAERLADGALLAATMTPASIAAFEVIVAGDEVAAKKPAPDVYLAALRGLRLPASACLAIEDTRNGLRAALGAGVATLITKSLYGASDEFPGAARIADSLGHLLQADTGSARINPARWLSALRRIHEAAQISK